MSAEWVRRDFRGRHAAWPAGTRLIVVVYDSFNRNNVKISKTYNFLDFSFFMSQDDAHYHNHQNAPVGGLEHLIIFGLGVITTFF